MYKEKVVMEKGREIGREREREGELKIEIDTHKKRI